MTKEQRADLALEVFNAAVAGAESFRSEDHIGSDLAYLMGAILNTEDEHSYVDWRPYEYGGVPGLVVILKDKFKSHHPVWNFIEL